MQNAAPQLTLKNLTVGYGGVPVVSGLNVVLPGGRISMIVGGSGCGKSTLLKNILRLYTPIAGQVLLGGHDVFTLKGKGLHCLRQRMGVLFQDGALLGSLTLGDNVALPLREHTRLPEPGIMDIVLAKRGLVGLAEFTGLYPNELLAGCASGPDSRGPWSWTRSCSSATSPPPGSTRSTPPSSTSCFWR